MVDRRISLKWLFIFTALAAISLACTTNGIKSEVVSGLLFGLGVLILAGLVLSVAGFLIGGRFGFGLGMSWLLGIAITLLIVLTFAASVRVFCWFVGRRGMSIGMLQSRHGD